MANPLIRNFEIYKVLNNIQIGFEFEFYSKLPYQKLLEKFNQLFNPIIVQGAHRYHSRIAVSPIKFKVEPDHSGGDDMIELVTHYFPYQDAKIILTKALTFLQEHCFTTEKCSIQFNISFNPERTTKSINNINILKFILNFDEEKIWKLFPERRNSVYAKSIKKIIPFKGIDFITTDINIIANNLRVPDSKYYGINFTKLQQNYLEYRYLGGKDYEYKTDQIYFLLDEFILDVYKCVDVPFAKEDGEVLTNYLEEQIFQYKNFNKIEYFLNNFPNIEILIDKSNNYDLLKAYWTKLYDKVFDFTINTKNLKNCILNWDSDYNRLEVVNASFDIVFAVTGVDFINCAIRGGLIVECNIIDSEVKDCIMEKCAILHSNIHSSKLSFCDTNKTTEIYDSYFSSGIMNSTFVRGVYRKGRKGPNASFSETKFVNVRKNFFVNKDDIDRFETGLDLPEIDKK